MSITALQSTESLIPRLGVTSVVFPPSRPTTSLAKSLTTSFKVAKSLSSSLKVKDGSGNESSIGTQTVRLCNRHKVVLSRESLKEVNGNTVCKRFRNSHTKTSHLSNESSKFSKLSSNESSKFSKLSSNGSSKFSKLSVSSWEKLSPEDITTGIVKSAKINLSNSAKAKDKPRSLSVTHNSQYAIGETRTILNSKMTGRDSSVKPICKRFRKDTSFLSKNLVVEDASADNDETKTVNKKLGTYRKSALLKGPNNNKTNENVISEKRTRERNCVSQFSKTSKPNMNDPKLKKQPTMKKTMVESASKKIASPVIVEKPPYSPCNETGTATSKSNPDTGVADVQTNKEKELASTYTGQICLKEESAIPTKSLASECDSKSGNIKEPVVTLSTIPETPEENTDSFISAETDSHRCVPDITVSDMPYADKPMPANSQEVHDQSTLEIGTEEIIESKDENGENEVSHSSLEVDKQKSCESKSRARIVVPVRGQRKEKTK
ncbi:hypothetical protein SK128_012725, partial [Halocaridina rubra]